MELHGVSIVICCYNSSQRLPRTLSYLANQKYDISLPCEIIVVDNASTDNTGQVAIDEWSNYKSRIPLHVLKETNQGLSYARKTGVDKSRYDIVIFCDDDNWLQDDFIRRAVELMDIYNCAGVIGGMGIPCVEITVCKKWLQQHEGIYAIGSQGQQEGIITNTRSYVYGAGSVWRKSLLKNILSQPLILTGRKGTKLSSGEDIELCFKAIIEGYEIVYSPKLVYIHFIPKARLSERYIRKFIQDSAPNAFHLHGLVYKAGIHKKMFNSQLKRTWWGQSLIILKNLFRNGSTFKISFLSLRELVILNTNYDKSFR